MKITLLVVGKTTERYYTEAVEEYAGRLKHYLPFEMEVLPDLKQTKNLTFEQIREREGEMILKRLQPSDKVVLLDERGKEFSSMQFAEYIEKQQHAVPKRLVFVIGGPYGFSPDVYGFAKERLSLSKMTFSHQMIRMVFVEQLYRAMTILSNEPYHHE